MALEAIAGILRKQNLLNIFDHTNVSMVPLLIEMSLENYSLFDCGFRFLSMAPPPLIKYPYDILFLCLKT